MKCKQKNSKDKVRLIKNNNKRYQSMWINKQKCKISMMRNKKSKLMKIKKKNKMMNSNNKPTNKKNHQ